MGEFLAKLPRLVLTTAVACGLIVGNSIPPVAFAVGETAQATFIGDKDPEGYFCPDETVQAGQISDFAFWKLNFEAELKYQWYRNGAPIRNETDERYVVSNGDLGKELNVAVTVYSSTADGMKKVLTVDGSDRLVKPCAVKASGDDEPVLSSGRSRVGDTIKLWYYSDREASVDYSWIRVSDGVVISKEPSLTLSVREYGEEIQLLAVFTKPGAWDVTKTFWPFTVNSGDLKALARPKISGELKVGSTVKIVDGKYNAPSVWMSEIQWFRDGQKIPNANERTYKLNASDAGKSMYATMNLNAEAYSGVNSWVESTDPVYGGNLEASEAPRVTGKMSWNSMLTATTGTWKIKPTSYSYQWYRNGKAIKNAIKSTYRSSPDDVGKKITVRVIAKRKGFGTGQAASNQVTVSGTTLSAKSKPKVTGTFRQNQTLKVSNGTWNAKPSSYSYSWYRNGKKISGATKSSYKLSPKDVGKKISVRVVAKRSGFKSGSFETKKTNVAPVLLKVSKKPKVSGSAKFGSTLKVSNGLWSKTPTSYSYSWYRNGKKISGANKKTYKLTSADVGKKISVRVVAKRKGYDNGQYATAAKKISAASFNKISKPTISGKAAYGKTLTANPGKSTPKATSYSYQWYRDGSPIKGATKKKYKAKYADVYSDLTVKVTSKRSGYKSSSRTSSAVWIWDEYDYDYDYGGSSSGKEPNRCYLPGGQSYYYC
ncbi:hypothetical protein [Glutamicibacter protophormiae]|uniref:hypothetical protein n=1 Tax=Glutamicibacter protophormiae TaxID=37930 RepID=UPI00361E58C1